MFETVSASHSKCFEMRMEMHKKVGARIADVQTTAVKKGLLGPAKATATQPGDDMRSKHTPWQGQNVYRLRGTFLSVRPGGRVFSRQAHVPPRLRLLYEKYKMRQ